MPKSDRHRFAEVTSYSIIARERKYRKKFPSGGPPKIKAGAAEVTRLVPTRGITPTRGINNCNNRGTQPATQATTPGLESHEILADIDAEIPPQTAGPLTPR